MHSVTCSCVDLFFNLRLRPFTFLHLCSSGCHLFINSSSMYVQTGQAGQVTVTSKDPNIFHNSPEERQELTSVMTKTLWKVFGIVMALLTKSVHARNVICVHYNILCIFGALVFIYLFIFCDIFGLGGLDKQIKFDRPISLRNLEIHDRLCISLYLTFSLSCFWRNTYFKHTKTLFVILWQKCFNLTNLFKYILNHLND